MKVFISSVRSGLADERDYLTSLLTAAGHEPLRFEDFTAQNSPSRAACLQGLERADVYLLVLGERYGDPTVDSGLSPTEEEFTAAKQMGIPVLVFRKEGGAREAAQAEFESRVGNYQQGRFWKNFSDAMDLGVSVIAALKDLSLPPAPLTWEPLTEPVSFLWRADRPELGPVPQYCPVLELHVVPVGGRSSLLTVGSLSGLADRLAGRARESELVNQGDALIVDSNSSSAWVLRRGESSRSGGITGVTTDPYFGIAIGRGGAVLAFQALPTDTLGTLVGQTDLTSRCNALLRLAEPHLCTDVDQVAIAVGIEPVDRVTIGDPGQMGSRTHGYMPMYGSHCVRVSAEDSVPRLVLDRASSEIAGEAAARLIQALQSAQ